MAVLLFSIHIFNYFSVGYFIVLDFIVLNPLAKSEPKAMVWRPLHLNLLCNLFSTHKIREKKISILYETLPKGRTILKTDQ